MRKASGKFTLYTANHLHWVRAIFREKQQRGVMSDFHKQTRMRTRMNLLRINLVASFAALLCVVTIFHSANELNPPQVFRLKTIPRSQK